MAVENRTLEAKQDTKERVAEDMETKPTERFETGIIRVSDRPIHLPLSFAQQRLWFLDQLNPESPLYNLPVALRIEGSLDQDALRNALSEIVARHEVLRTRFVAVDGNPMQIISPPAPVELPVKDLSSLAETSRERETQRLLADEARRPFNLAVDLMLRCLLIRINAHEHVLLFTIHHIATDAWSTGVFFSELAECYEAFHCGRKPELPELEIQYADFALWQQKQNAETFEPQLSYWKQRLAGAKENLELPLDRPRRAQQTFAGAVQTRLLRPGLMEALRQFSQRERVSLFMTLMAGFKVLLHRYSGQDDIMVGMPTANRDRVETERNIGFFVNTVIARTDVSGNPTFRELLRRVRNVTFDAVEHQDVPFERLVAELHPKRSTSQIPLIQVMFALQRPATDGVKLGDLRLTPVEVQRDVAKFDLTLFMEERGREGAAALEYNTDLFDAATISRMLGHLEQLLEGIVADPTRKISELPMLTETELEQVLVEWNQTSTDYPRDKSVHELFEEQARSHPNSVAVVFGGRSLTYKELDGQANRLARHLASRGIQPGDIIAVCLDRSLEMIIALVGILKAGGAYASLDPSSPKGRLAMMLQDLRTPLVLTEEKYKSRFSDEGTTPAPQLLCTGANWNAIWQESAEPLELEIPATSLAYVSFTSGSTGKPKGVCVPHRAVVRLAKNTNFASFSPEEVFLQMAPVSFDASTLELWCCLLNRARLVVMPPEIPSLSDIKDTICKNGVTIAWFTSGLFNQMVDEEPDGLKPLRQILAGGDVLSPLHVKRALGWPGERCIINGYGPTENTTFTTCYTVPRNFAGDRPLPIGRPICNTQCYILDRRLQPVPIGVPGELYAGGDGLATGYLNSPELTAEKFIANPFKPGTRLYKTGDLARWLPDGNIEYLGRADTQVKIRGFRIELGEIETVLNTHPAIQESAVIAVGEGGEKRLCAFYVALRQSKPDAGELRDLLRSKLPESMVPSQFIPMESLPLTANGKTDRRALLPHTEKERVPEKASEPPKDALESDLTAIWESVLGVHPIGREERFFELGGHSLLAVRLVARLEKKFERKFPLSVVFQAQTIADMAQYLRGGQAAQSSSVVAIQSGGSKPPLFFVHGVGGGMFWGYTNLSRSLGPDQPLYVLKSRAMDGQQEFEHIEEMAAQYISDLRSVQPSGPYYIGGFCFGGVVAYEMARQLESAGETVAMLAALNSAPPNSDYWRFRWTPRSLFRFARNLGLQAVRSMRWDPQQRRQFFRWKTAQARRKLHRLLNMPRGGSYQVSPEEIVDFSSFTSDQRQLWESHIRSLVQYFPQRHSGKVTFFRSRGHPLLCSYDPRCGWDALAGEVELHVVPGEHESILEEPHVVVLAGELKHCLHRLQANGPSGPKSEQPTAKVKVSDVQSAAFAVEPTVDYPREVCVHQLFEEQVRRTPDAPALLCDSEELSYGEVNRRANQLAHHLESLGVGPDVPVGVSLERSPDLVIAILGVLKAGGAYVPMDPAYPKERLAKMLESSRAPILLTHGQFAGLFPTEQTRTVLMEALPSSGLKETNPVCRAAAKNLAYVIYTSGSTGQPKGVAMEHRPLANLLWWQLKNSAMGKGDRTLQFASASFDVSFQEIFSTWCSGGELVLIDEDVRHDARKLARLIVEKEVKRLFLPFIALNHLSEFVGAEELHSMRLREVVTAGEQLRITNKIVALFEALPGCTLHNHYGPSESHVVTAYTLGGAPSEWQSLPPIGKPISNSQIYLLDPDLKTVPQGEAGEIHIGGDCLARGYLHRPELTEERFLKNPFSAEPEGRMYKTGDMARQLPDGNLEFLGRVDHQVKIRGFRVELSEIEAALGKHPGVRACAVAAREDAPGQRRLVGYVVRQSSHVLGVSELRRAILEKLPDYMAPSAFVFLDDLPLTPSGKVNRLALPAPDQNRPQLGGEYVAPANETERRMAEVWGEVLGVKEVGTRDNFFELGGNSLSAGQVISRIRETFNVELPVSSLFEAPTIGAMAEGISSRRWTETQSAPPLKRIRRNDNPPVSFTQARLWFIDRLQPGNNAYNVPAAVRIRGPLDLNALQASIDRIVSRHDALRTTIQFVDGNLTQAIAKEAHVRINVLDCANVPDAQRETHALKLVEKEAARPFNLAHGPLVRCAIARLSEHEHILLVVMHHVISDGWALGVFFKELDLLYRAKVAGQSEPLLPLLPVQYGDYASWQQEWMHGAVLDLHVAFWTEKLRGAPFTLELPSDSPPEIVPATRVAVEKTLVPRLASESLYAFCRREEMTPFMALLAGLAITLERWTEQSDMVIGTVVAGRNHREVENLIGCFMNFLPLRMSVPEGATSREFLAQVKHAVIEAQAHQDCPFEKIVEAVNPERKMVENPLYNVALLVQNFPAIGFSGGLKSEPLALDSQSALLDLRFMVEGSASELSITCEYKADLFAAETIRKLMASFSGVMAALVEDSGKKINDYQLLPELAAQSRAARQREDRQTIAVAATFTAEPVEDSLRYWMKELGINARIEFAPFNQVFQQLLDPSSVLSANQRGINVFFLRLEDWEKVEGGETVSAQETAAAVERSVGEFITSLKAFLERGAAPCLVCVCPPSQTVAQNANRLALHQRLEAQLSSAFELIPGAYFCSAREMDRLYPVSDRDDVRSEEFGAIPYTVAFYAALGTMVARKFHALKRPAYKVIAVDCDQTIWSGVCGEDGAEGIQIDAPRRELQEFLRAQSAAGMLICICSKNNNADVAAVFDIRTEMPLKRENIAGWRVNWLPKSQNLKSLAAELRVGLDSFIFLDDNPVECAEVAANCPGVLTLQLPEGAEQIPRFIEHCWAFDHLKVSTEDRQRSASYHQEKQREELRAQSPSLSDFLAGLDLKVEITRLSAEQLTRVAQLTMRTNQFNFTTHRRTETELQTVVRAGKTEILTVTVKDRFGAYGLVGVIIHEPKGAALDVETFLLSCRVLGRGVECQMTRRLGQAALARGLARVDLHFIPSDKNQPAHTFLENVGSRFRQPVSNGFVYRLPSEFAAGLANDSGFVEQKRVLDSTSSPAPKNTPLRGKFNRYNWIARELNDAGRILAAIDAKFRLRHNGHGQSTPPETEAEKLLCGIWEKLLRRDKIGVKDNFFELGGHSLLAVRLFSEIERVTGRKLPLVTVFQSPTIRELAEVLSHETSVARSCLVSVHGEGSRPPLFLIHGAGGDVLWGYANLAAHLGDDQPVYGVKSRALDGSDEFASIEEMAAHYVQQIQALQPHGPYHLGGYCFGGNVAYEMARQLDAAGEKIEFLALLDSAPMNAGYEQMRWWLPGFHVKFMMNLFLWLFDFAKLPWNDQREFAFRKARTLYRKLLRKFGADNREKVDLEEVIDLTKFPPHELRLWQVHLDLLVRHASKPYSGKVTLFRTRGQPLFCSLEEDFGWGRLVRDVEKRIVSGSHESIFIEPNVRTLAASLKECVAYSKPGSPVMSEV